MNSNIRRKIPVTGALLLAISSMMISCTKTVPYKEVYKEHVESKSTLSPDDEYLFVASSDLSNNDDAGVSSALPFWQGQEKIVKFRFTENSLQVLEVNDESRLAKDNTLNNKVLMEIPIKNVEYRCSQDRYGKCTNREEENSEISWSQKNKFIPDFGGIKTTGFSMLPVEMEQIYGFSCYSETSSRFLNYEMKDGALNIQVEKVFRGNAACLGNQLYAINSIDDLQSQIIYHYSFTKLNKVATPNYKAIDYPNKDSREFGFFTTANRKYDTDLTRTQANDKQYLNRWSPDRKEIVYYMSDNFNKPQYASVKEATRTAFARVNAGLAAAGLETRLVIKDPDHKQPGDNRNSMIVMVEDPVAGGPLGYGPTVANPRTGEIISGRVAMYYGNFVQGVRYTYDEVVRELYNSGGMKDDAPEKAESSDKDKEIQKDINADLKLKNRADTYAGYTHAHKVGLKAARAYTQAKSQNSKNTLSSNSPLANSVKRTSDGKTTTGQRVSEYLNSMPRMNARYNSKPTLLAAADADEDVKNNTASQVIDALSVMSKYCNYPSELFPFSEYIKTALQGKLGKKLKLWNDLSDKERADVIAIVMPEVWVPTLIHELGHNLGLRHNFRGSEDRANFYTQNELAKMGVKHAVPYSSVMDYGYSELNLLPTLGKYDIAALRFAYKRQVMTETGSMVAIPETLEKLKADKKDDLELRHFSYCSDESVDMNPGCKRFDKGTTNVEIVSYLIKHYEEMYKARNFRNGRENFSTTGVGGYYSARLAQFQYIRNFMEVYEDIKRGDGIEDDDMKWQADPLYKDLKDAALISGRFFLDVLNTPEIHCAAAKASNPNLIVDISPLQALAPGYTNCFDLDLTNDLIVVGQAGKPFDDKTYTNNPAQYADQIDIRGIGPDKLAAAQALFTRTQNGSRQHEANYMDMKDLAPEITETVTGLLLNQTNATMSFYGPYGKLTAKTKWTTHNFSTPSEYKAGKAAHWFDVPLLDSAARRMGIPNHNVSFQEMLLKIITRRMSGSQTHAAEDKAFVDQFRVNRIAKTAAMSSENFVTRDVGTYKTVAMEENSVATDAMNTIKKNDALSSLSAKELEALRLERNRPANLARTTPPSPELSKILQPQFQDVTAIDLSLFANDALPKTEILDYLLTILPGAEETK